MDFLRNYLLAEDVKGNDFLSRSARLVLGSLPTLASLGAIYEFRSDPESIILTVGAVENLRVWTKYIVLPSINSSH
jgi:hypothetical protein